MSSRPLHELTLAEARRRQAAEQPAPLDSRVVTSDVVDGPAPIRLFAPRDSRRHPLCVWFPGGGWVLDTLHVSAAALSRIAAETPCTVAAVQYRLAPEHPFPIPLEDCLAATEWLVSHGVRLGVDPARIAVGGTSAGANLAAALALANRDAGRLEIALQVLVYPALLYGADTESMRVEGDASFDRHAVAWYWSRYLRHASEGSDPLASPLRAPNLDGLSPAFVVTAEHDPLRDEGELYVERLREAGVEARLVRVANASHGFFSGTDDDAVSAQRLVATALRTALSAASA